MYVPATRTRISAAFKCKKRSLYTNTDTCSKYLAEGEAGHGRGGGLEQDDRDKDGGTHDLFLGRVYL
jgi:hypothetical protein